MTTCQMSSELGAYVLHALEHDEDEDVRRHVADCDLCQDEVRELSFTASLLSFLTLADLERIDADEAAAGSPGSHGGSRRRLGRRTMLAVAAALVATLTIPAARVLEHPAAGPSTHVLSATDPATHVSAAVSLARLDSGTRVDLDLTGAYPTGWCALVARARDGRSDTAATWRADVDGEAHVAGTTAIPTSELKELDVVTDNGRVLVRIPVHHQDS
jgi:hypothetical protein